MKCKTCCGHGKRRDANLNVVQCNRCGGTGKVDNELDSLKGGRKPGSRLRIPQFIIEQIKGDLIVGVPMSQIRKKYSVGASTVYKIKSGQYRGVE